MLKKKVTSEDKVIPLEHCKNVLLMMFTHFHDIITIVKLKNVKQANHL